MTSTQTENQPKAPSHAFTYRIDSFNGDDATDFFGSDFHLDNTVATNLKLKTSTPGSSFKMTFKTKPTGENVSTSTEGTFVFPINEQWSSNGHPLSTELKFKPKAFNFTFSYNPFQLSGTQHWLNPYFGVNIPSTFENMNRDATLTFGNILHTNGDSINSTTNTQLTISTNSENNMEFDTISNTAVYWKFLTFSSIARMSFRRYAAFSKSTNFNVGAEWKNIWANLCLEQKGENNNLGVGLKHQVNDKVAVGVQRWQELTPSGLGASTIDIAAQYDHCRGMTSKAVLSNFQTLSFWANFTPNCKVVSGSVCYERDLKGTDFNWGAKLNINV